MTAIYDLTPDALRARIAERKQWAAEAREAGWHLEAEVHDRMAELYRLRVNQLEGTEREKQR
ncbi:hypothetical protein ACH6CV_16785 [Bacillota bacterium Meth-B3]